MPDTAYHDAHDDPRRALEQVLGFIGLADTAHAQRVTIDGHDPVVPSRHKLGSASAAALAAQAVAVAELWADRGGDAQQLAVDLRQAAYPGLCTFMFLEQNGYRLPFVRYDGQGPNFFRTADDRRFYLLYTAHYVQHCLDVHRFLGASTGHASVAQAVARWRAADLEEALAERRLIGATARTRDEWLAHPQGRVLAGRPAVEIERLDDAAARPLGAGARPLSGVRVVDMAHVLAGPVASRVLAEQGADVIHLSAPHQADGLLIDLDTGFGKRTASLDLDRADDCERLRQLIRDADVFIQSWRPGALARRGFSPQEVAALRPGIVYASISCYGCDGPWAERGGYEPIGQAVSGLAISEGSEDQPALACTFTLNDYLTAYLAAAGIVAALGRRGRSGGSHHVKASLTQTSMWVQSLGRLPSQRWPGATGGVAQLPPVREADLMDTDSVYGRLRHARPIARYSATPARWTRPPSPTGAGALRWEERR